MMLAHTLRAIADCMLIMCSLPYCSDVYMCTLDVFVSNIGYVLVMHRAYRCVVYRDSRTYRSMLLVVYSLQCHCAVYAPSPDVYQSTL